MRREASATLCQAMASTELRLGSAGLGDGTTNLDDPEAFHAAWGAFLDGV